MPTTYYDDDFQAYAIGTVLPFGSWIGSGFTDEIAAGGSGIPTTDRHLKLVFATAEVNPLVPGYLSSFSQFVAIKFLQPPSFGAPTLRFQNGPNGSAQTFDILKMFVEVDSTISFYDGQNVLIGNSIDAWFVFNSWNFFQVNVTLSDVLVAGVLKVAILIELGLNGKSVLTTSRTTNINSAGLKNGVAEIDRFQLVGDGEFAAYTLTSLQAIATYPHAGAPKLIAYQAPIEVDLLPDSGDVKIFQTLVEADLLPTNANIRILQALIEVDLRQRQGQRADYIHRRHFPGD